MPDFCDPLCSDINKGLTNGSDVYTVLALILFFCMPLTLCEKVLNPQYADTAQLLNEVSRGPVTGRCTQG